MGALRGFSRSAAQEMRSHRPHGGADFLKSTCSAVGRVSILVGDGQLSGIVNIYLNGYNQLRSDPFRQPLDANLSGLSSNLPVCC